MGPPPAYVSARGLTHAACSTTFGDDVQTWPDGDPPMERDRCDVCQAAYRRTVLDAEERRRSLDERPRAAYVIGAEGDSL